jgi:predicted nucleic acid binding AN1-type Zn finger protein
MLYKSSKAGSMHRTKQSLLLLATFSLLISSCQLAETASVKPKTISREIPIVSVLINPPAQAADPTENNECLNCHSDKDRLIETAAPEAPVETESRGVG